MGIYYRADVSRGRNQQKNFRSNCSYCRCYVLHCVFPSVVPFHRSHLAIVFLLKWNREIEKEKKESDGPVECTLVDFANLKRSIASAYPDTDGLSSYEWLTNADSATIVTNLRLDDGFCFYFSYFCIPTFVSTNRSSGSMGWSPVVAAAVSVGF